MTFLELKIAPPIQVGLLALTAWFIHERFEIIHIHSLYQTQIALILGALSIVLFLVSAGQFFAKKTTINPMKVNQVATLMTKGVFSLSRNPIYLADLIFLAAWIVWLGEAANLILPMIFVCYCTRFQILPEENALKLQFGEAYTNYQRRVRRWI